MTLHPVKHATIRRVQTPRIAQRHQYGKFCIVSGSKYGQRGQLLAASHVVTVPNLSVTKVFPTLVCNVSKEQLPWPQRNMSATVLLACVRAHWCLLLLVVY